MKIYGTEQVKSINWDKLDIAPLGGEMAEDFISIINRSCNYITNHWWRYRRYHKLNQQIYITFSSSSEKAVLPNAHAARVLATAIKFNILEPSIAKHNHQKVQDKAIKLIRSLSHGYIANMANGWRAMSIVAQTAYAGVLMWDKLNKRDQMLLINMLEHSASELLDIKQSYNYYEGRPEVGGNIIHHVSSNAERAMILSIAALIMPDHEKAAKWAVKARLFLKTSLSIKEDGSKGNNYNEEMLIITRGDVDAEQMAMMCGALDSISSSLLLEGQPYYESLDNARRIYSSFTNLYIARGRKAWEPLYAVDIDNKPIGRINIPGKAEKLNLMPYVLMDTYAYSCDLDTESEHSAREWAECKLQHILYRQKSNSAGRYFRGTNARNRERETKFGAEAAMAYVMLYLKASGMIKHAE